VTSKVNSGPHCVVTRGGDIPPRLRAATHATGQRWGGQCNVVRVYSTKNLEECVWRIVEQVTARVVIGRMAGRTVAQKDMVKWQYGWWV